MRSVINLGDHPFLQEQTLQASTEDVYLIISFKSYRSIEENLVIY